MRCHKWSPILFRFMGEYFYVLVGQQQHTHDEIISCVILLLLTFFYRYKHAAAARP